MLNNQQCCNKLSIVSLEEQSQSRPDKAHTGAHRRTHIHTQSTSYYDNATPSGSQNSSLLLGCSLVWNLDSVRFDYQRH